MLIPFRKQEKWGFVDENRNLMIDFDDVQVPFRTVNHGFSIVRKDNKRAWIDKTGRAITPWAFCCCEFDANELSIILLSQTSQPGNCIFLNSAGQIAFEQSYSNATTFSEGISIVTDVAGKMGAINYKGEIVVPVVHNNWEEVNSFLSMRTGPDYKSFPKNESVVAFWAENGMCGLKNLAGDIIVPAKYRHILNDYDPDTVAIGSYCEFWHVDNEGNRLYEKNYNFAQNFNEGIARVVTSGGAGDPYMYSNWSVDYYIPKEAQWGYINKKGEEFWED